MASCPTPTDGTPPNADALRGALGIDLLREAVARTGATVDDAHMSPA